MATNNATNTSNPITVAQGGTGLATLTAHAVQVGNGTGTITQVPVGGANSVLIGVASSDPTFSTTGQIEVTSLGVGTTPGASGITFNGTDLLGAYTIGTWTPTITGSTGNPTPTYVVQDGNYVKIGKVVFFQCRIQVSALTGGTGNLQVSSFPFTIANFASPQSASGAVVITGNTNVSVFNLNQNTTLSTLVIAAGITNLVLPQTTLTFITTSGSYIATS